MDSFRLAVLLGGTFFLAFGLAAYRYFYTVLGATAGLAGWMALSGTLVRLPGLREHPGTASLLILALLVLTGVFLASKFRRLLVFFSGLGTGLLLSQTFSVFMTGGALSDTAFRFGRINTMDILVGLIGGILFLLFERVFALLLTSVVGSFLCTWAIGGRWTFVACLLIGLVAQPLVFTRFKPPPPAAGGKDRTGSTTLMVFLLLWLLPAQAAANWVVERVHPSTSRVVIGVGWRDGVKENESYAVIDDRGSLIAVISVDEVFSTSSYSVAISLERFNLVRPAMQSWRCLTRADTGWQSYPVPLMLSASSRKISNQPIRCQSEGKGGGTPFQKGVG
ncbi:TMEM198/TM7SF3 family protein [bacterium]|nr:TMEM198/TM7SF3 family protein [bacterium]